MTRAAVLEAARALVDDAGVEALTMRRLADRLGVAPNSLYSQYPHKAALLADLLDRVLADVEVPDLDAVAWQDGVIALMDASRAVLVRHADLLPLLLSRPMRGPQASRLAEATLALLARGGIEGPAAVDALRAVLTLTFGTVVLAAPRHAEPDPAGREMASRAAFASRSDLPRVAALAGPLSRAPADDAFATSLRWLLDGIARDVATGPRRRRPRIQ